MTISAVRMEPGNVPTRRAGCTRVEKCRSSDPKDTYAAAIEILSFLVLSVRQFAVEMERGNVPTFLPVLLRKVRLVVRPALGSMWNWSGGNRFPKERMSASASNAGMRQSTALLVGQRTKLATLV